MCHVEMMAKVDICVKTSIILDMNDTPSRQRGSKDLWLNAAYQMLVSDGISAVKVMTLAKKLNQSRTGFYWFFSDIDELHLALIERWQKQNTGNLVARCQMDADNISAALFNVMDCWLRPDLFDARLDLAIRNWGRVEPTLQQKVDDADRQRIDAIAAMFKRFDFPSPQAETRALTVIFTQIGYISMHIEEPKQERLNRVQHYVEIFAGTCPMQEDVNRFLERHG